MEAKRADKGKQERKRRPRTRRLKVWQDTKIKVPASQTTLTCVTGRLAVTFKAGRELKPGQSLDLANCSDVKIQAIESSTYILKAEK